VSRGKNRSHANVPAHGSSRQKNEASAVLSYRRCRRRRCVECCRARSTQYRCSCRCRTSWPRPVVHDTARRPELSALAKRPATMHTRRKSCFVLLLGHSQRAEYCNERVCLSVREHISRTTLYFHTHLFNGPFLGLPRSAGTRKVKSIWILLKARDSEWQWHQLGHMQVCTSLQTDNHASTPPLSFYRPDALPAAQPTAPKHFTSKRHQICSVHVTCGRGSVLL